MDSVEKDDILNFFSVSVNGSACIKYCPSTCISLRVLKTIGVGFVQRNTSPTSRDFTIKSSLVLGGCLFIVLEAH